MCVEGGGGRAGLAAELTRRGRHQIVSGKPCKIASISMISPSSSCLRYMAPGHTVEVFSLIFTQVAKQGFLASFLN